MAQNVPGLRTLPSSAEPQMAIVWEWIKKKKTGNEYKVIWTRKLAGGSISAMLSFQNVILYPRGYSFLIIKQWVRKRIRWVHKGL